MVVKSGCPMTIEAFMFVLKGGVKTRTRLFPASATSKFPGLSNEIAPEGMVAGPEVKIEFAAGG